VYVVGNYPLLERTCYLQLELRADYPEDGGSRFFQNFNDRGCSVPNQKTKI
jgi:hypothetical protein